MAVHFQPHPFHTVTPYLRLRRGVEALEFYKKAFKAEEVMRLMMPDDRLGHAEICIGDSIIMLSDEFPEMNIVGPETLGGASAGLMIYVPDADATFRQAVSAGATVLMDMKDQFYGDRSGKLQDPFGHEWTIATHVEDLTEDEIKRRMEAMGG